MPKSARRWGLILLKAFLFLFLSGVLPYIFLFYFARDQPDRIERWTRLLETEFGKVGARAFIHYSLLPVYLSFTFLLVAPIFIFARPNGPPFGGALLSWILLGLSFLFLSAITAGFALVVFQELFGNAQHLRYQAKLSTADIERRAYELWRERGCPVGSPEIDWFRATQEIENARQLSLLIHTLLGSFFASLLSRFMRTGFRLMLALAVTYLCTIYLFASLYGMIARFDRCQFTAPGPSSFLNALYFTLTTAVTIGDPDVHARLPLAKAVVMLQLLAFLAYTVLFFSLAAGAIRKRLSANG